MSSSPSALPAVLAHLQQRQERFLWNVHAADAFHAFFAFFLFFEELTFAADVAAVALGPHETKTLDVRYESVSRHGWRVAGCDRKDHQSVAPRALS